MKTGLFFGSFNPYHLGHKIVASYMAEFTDLDQIWIIISKPSYTINTLKVLREKHPGNEFVLIMGADNLEHFDKWKDYQKILEKHLLYIYPRPGIEITMKHKNIKVFQDVPQIEISASFIREKIKEKKNISYLIPEKAFNYIDEMNFYRN